MNKFNQILTSLILSFLLVGCAGMADSMNEMAGLGVVSEDTSTFDGAKVISVSPNWLYESKETWTANNVKLGARWSSNSPEEVALILSYSSSTSSNSTYLGLKGIDINIDGEISSFSSGRSTMLDNSSYNTVSKTIYTSSENTVIIPFKLLTEMVNSNSCRIRIHTSKGYEDAIFSIERSDSGQSTALFSFKKFLTKVDTINS